MLIYIIPTYECGLNCKSCYSQKYKEIYSECLTWEMFISIYNRFEGKLNRVAFIGGEAIKWKFINEAILFLSNKGIKVSVFTNGMDISRTMPDHVIINANNLLTEFHSDLMINSIEQYKVNRVKVTLRFNIDKSFEKYIGNAIVVSKKYADFVSLSPLFPVKYSEKKVGSNLFMLAQGLIDNKITSRVSRAVPLCIFTENQRIYLEKNCNMRGVCSLPTNSIVVNPDGVSVQPCVELSIIKKLDSLINKSIKEEYRCEIQTLKNEISCECAECAFYKGRKCFGGCLAYK